MALFVRFTLGSGPAESGVWTAAFDPGCVKTWTPRPSAQQLNREGSVDESLLPRTSASRLNISSRSPKNGFHTAWVTTGPSAALPGTSAPWGKADEIGAKADIGARMSAVRGEADVPQRGLGLLLVATTGHSGDALEEP